MRFVGSFLAIAAYCVSTASAQTPDGFDGRITRNGRAVAGASVSIEGASSRVRTDADGRFSWSPVPPAPFAVIVILPGGEVARPIVITAVTGLLTLDLQPVADEAIAVLGVAPSITTSPGSAMTVLSGAQLAARVPENLVQALETVPGVAQVSEGHAGVPAIRGLARGRTLLLVNGARVTAERRVGPAATFLDPSVVEGVDVARGPGSVAYGSDAIGGVVSVRTRRAEPGSPLRARVAGTFGTGAPDRRGSLEVSQGFARGGVLVQAHVRNAEDYDGPTGEVFNSGWEDRGVLAHLTHELFGGMFSAVWQTDLARDVERPRDNSRTVRFYYPFEDSHRLTASFERAAGGFDTIAVTGFFGRSEQRTDQDRGATASAGRSIERADVSAGDFHLKANAGRALRALGGARLEVGVDVNGRFNLRAVDTRQHFGGPSGALTEETSSVSVSDADRVDTGVYADVAAAAGGWLRLGGGIRLDRVSSTNTAGFFGDHQTTHAAPSGYGAVTVRLAENVNLTTQVARAFRDPVLSDRFFRGPSGRGFITGNPGLHPETTLQLDVALRHTTRRTQAALYVYEYRIRDLIERYQTDTDFFFFRNRDRARLRGVEVEARAALGHGVSLEFGAQRGRGRTASDGAALDDVSTDSVSVLGRKEFRRVYAQARLAILAADARPGPNEVAAPGATLLDLGGGWDITSRIDVRAVVRNALDRTYYASPDPRFVLAPGRSASVTAGVRF